MVDGPLFIVDNSPGRAATDSITYASGQSWRSGIDIATGYFEIGSLLDLDGHWQRFDKIRILMGDEISHRTKKALLLAVKQRAEERLDESIEDGQGTRPVPDRAWTRSWRHWCRVRSRCRVYNKDKFHAKAYITHGRFEVIGSQALVGSSNFTRPGLTQNVELNIKIESSSEVAQLQELVRAPLGRRRRRVAGRREGDPASRPGLQPVRCLRPGAALDVRRAGADGERLGPASLEDVPEARPLPAGGVLGDGQHRPSARRRASSATGSVSARRTSGSLLLERLVLHENKRVVLFAPKSVKDSVWVPELRRHLPHIGGVDGSADFSNLSVFSHTDLTRALEFPERFERITELADAVVIDEAHHFRNTGKRGDPGGPVHPVALLQALRPHRRWRATRACSCSRRRRSTTRSTTSSTSSSCSAGATTPTSPARSASRA
ncbi:MAG: phospholipase D-like domain-containing protein [Ilumatobacteraceae bacterium]